ncbi:MAG: 2-oxo acid dehydrogenase subunit E2 [Acidimicrobiales bacterium]|jgi:hypothetical protein
MWWKRCDGDLVHGTDAERRIMPYLMRGRNESITYLDAVIDLTTTDEFLAEFRRRNPDVPVTLFHLVIWALGRTIYERPHLNRFVAGGRHYDRKGIFISFAAKQEMKEDAPLVVVKHRVDPSQPFYELVADLHSEIDEARSPGTTTIDRELSVLLHLPGSGLRAVLALERVADRLGVLPASFVDPDPMFTSAWVANLGSLKMDPVFHHLYEYGNAGLFCTIGQVVSEPIVRDGQVVAGRVAHLRCSYDERIDDGMYAGSAARLMTRLLEQPLANGCELSPASIPGAAEVDIRLAS